MKKFLLETAKIVGTATDQAWSQVHTFSPTEANKLSQRGQFLAVISLSEPDEGVELVTAGREIISRLHEEYYGQLEEKAIDQLKKALEKILGEVAEGAKVEIEAAALVGEVLYLAIAGRGKIIVQRQGKTATILTGKGEKVEVASGQAKSGDMLLLGSQKLFSLLAEGAIGAALSVKTANEAAESLVPMIHGREENGTAAAAVLRLEEVAKAMGVEAEQPRESAEKEKPTPKRWLIKEVMKEKLAPWLKQGMKVGQLLLFKLGKRLKRRAIYLSPEEKEKQKPQRTLMTVAVILLILLLVSVVLGIRQRGRTRKTGDVVTILRQAQIKKEEGEALIELNPIRARQLLLEAQSLIEAISPEETTQAVIDFQKELDQSLSLVMREHEAEATVFFELGLIKEGARSNDTAVSGGELFIFDQEKKTIYSLEISRRKSAILAGGDDLAGGKQVAAFLPKIYLLTERGVLEYDKETKRQELVVEIEEDWGEIVDLRAFGGNLYLLDKQGEIWKYPGIEGGFGAYRLWLKGEKPDFSDAIGMSIDASIWVLKADGTILKFTQGKRDHFAISGLDRSFNDPVAIFTDDDQENLYILDKGNSRVVVVDKSGEYHSQYLWEGMDEATALVASEEEKKIFLLAGDKVYQIGMR